MDTPIDLHCHSTASDGILDPKDLVKRAFSNGCTTLALTDHDCIDGLVEANNTAIQYGMKFISGIEISVTWNSKTLHIVGLDIDETNNDMINVLSNLRKGRIERAIQISDELSKVGIEGAFEGASKYCKNIDMISRTHFARFLVENDYVNNIENVFEHYLVEGKVGYVPHNWISLKEAINLIIEANGIPIIAHPARYKLDDDKLNSLIKEFIKYGGLAIESISGRHTIEENQKFIEFAKKYNLYVSAGSDFHQPSSDPYREVGKTLSIPSDVESVLAII